MGIEAGGAEPGAGRQAAGSDRGGAETDSAVASAVGEWGSVRAAAAEPEPGCSGGIDLRQVRKPPGRGDCVQRLEVGELVAEMAAPTRTDPSGHRTQ